MKYTEKLLPGVRQLLVGISYSNEPPKAANAYHSSEHPFPGA